MSNQTKQKLFLTPDDIRSPVEKRTSIPRVLRGARSRTRTRSSIPPTVDITEKEERIIPVEQDKNSLEFEQVIQIVEYAEMAYEPWPMKAMMFSMHQFVKIQDLMRVMLTLRRKNYSVKASRDEMIQLLNDMPAESVFDKTTRFPGDTLYVNVTQGVIADLLEKMNMALDVGERFLSHDNSANGQFSSLNDAKLSYSKSVTRLIEILTSSDSATFPAYKIFDQRSIERELGITWLAAAQQQQVNGANNNNVRQPPQA